MSFKKGDEVEFTDFYFHPPFSGVGTVTEVDEDGWLHTNRHGPDGAPVVLDPEEDLIKLHERPYTHTHVVLGPTAAKKEKGWRMYYDNSSARRKDRPVAEGCLDYMPAAIMLCAELSRLGNEKHNPGEELHHARAKSKDHRNCAVRHLMDADSIDEETDLVEAVAAFWRTGIYVQELCERKYGWPKAPRAK